MTWSLAYSTLGCPALPPAEVASLARATGWTGLELRAAADEPVHIGLSISERFGVRDILAEGGAHPLAVASYVRVACVRPMTELTAAELAGIEREQKRIQATYLRVKRPASTARGVHHVALLSSNVERIIRFYQDLPEFPLTEIFENRDFRAVSPHTQRVPSHIRAHQSLYAITCPV